MIYTKLAPITWVKRTAHNVNLLATVADEHFWPVATAIPLGKTNKQHIIRVADTTLDFPHLGAQRVVVLETNTQKRIGIYTTAPHPTDVPLSFPSPCRSASPRHADWVRRPRGSGFRSGSS